MNKLELEDNYLTKSLMLSTHLKIEPNNINESIVDEFLVEANQEELNLFERNEV